MRFMIIVKSNPEAEAGIVDNEQTQKMFAEMTRYNEELVKAGIMLSGEGLYPSAKGARVRFSGDKRSVIDGPFAEAKELVAGFWIWQCKSLDEAISWAKRCPNPTGVEGELEIRQVHETEDLPQGEWTETEKKLRDELAARGQK